MTPAVAAKFKDYVQNYENYTVNPNNGKLEKKSNDGRGSRSKGRSIAVAGSGSQPMEMLSGKVEAKDEILELITKYPFNPPQDNFAAAPSQPASTRNMDAVSMRFRNEPPALKQHLQTPKNKGEAVNDLTVKSMQNDNVRNFKIPGYLNSSIASNSSRDLVTPLGSQLNVNVNEKTPYVRAIMKAGVEVMGSGIKEHRVQASGKMTNRTNQII